MGRKRHASSSPTILPTTSSPLPWANKQAQISSPQLSVFFILWSGGSCQGPQLCKNHSCLPCGEAVTGHCWVQQSCSWRGDAWPGRELEGLGKLGWRDWLPGGSAWQRNPGSPGSCRSQTARKARKAKGGWGGTGPPLSSQRTLTFRCSYQHLALLSSLFFLLNFHFYGAWMELDFLCCFLVGMIWWIL